MSFLGVDVGTTGCKSGVFSEDGILLGFSYEEYDYATPRSGWAELRSEQVWEKIRRTIRRAARNVRRDPVQALSVSSLGESVVSIDAGGRILGPSILNFDSRGGEYLEEIEKWMPADRFYGITGNTLGSNYSITTLKWLKERQPRLYENTHLFLLWSGLVSFMLGADPTVDYSLANRTLLFDLEATAWSQELLDRSGLDRDKFPPIVPSGVRIGSLKASEAADLGLPTGIPIISGGHDQSCNGIGAGVLSPGQAMFGMGTYLCMMPVFKRRPPAEMMVERGLNTEHHAAPARFVSFLYNPGGLIVKWFRNTFAEAEMRRNRSDSQDLYAALLAEMPKDPSRVMVLPHFSTTGPPHYITDSSGVMAGLVLDTSRGEILKGLIEGMTFYVRECAETLPDVGIESTSFRAVGGGSHSDVWMQISADIFGRPFSRPRIREAGTLGAAILAATGSGAFSSLEDAVEAMVQPGDDFEPEPSRRDLYDERFEKYRALWPLMADYLRSLE